MQRSVIQAAERLCGRSLQHPLDVLFSPAALRSWPAAHGAHGSPLPAGLMTYAQPAVHQPLSQRLINGHLTALAVRCIHTHWPTSHARHVPSKCTSWPHLSSSLFIVKQASALRTPAASDTSHTAVTACRQHATALWHPAGAATGRRCFASQTHPKQQATAAEMGMYGAAAAISMIGFAYASVPLYKVFCAATGYGGTVAGAATVEEKLRKRNEKPNAEIEKAAASRDVTVWFNADVTDDMPWSFQPTQESVRVKPGQSTLAFFTAHNKSDKPVTGFSVYSVSPDKAAQYFNKIQCFCFEEQRLRAGETVDMPVFFYLDPELAADWNCRNVNDITLSYVFHKVDDADLEDYVDDDSDGAVPGSGIKLHGPGLARMPGGTAAALMAAGGDTGGNR